MSTQRQLFVAELTTSMNLLSHDVESFLRTCQTGRQPPPVIYHFTDSAGLVGILSEHKLRASLATTLNDMSEVKYAIDRVRALFDSGAHRLRHLDWQLLRGFLDGQSKLEGVMADSRCYVASFCAADDAVHWFHYGRAGTGLCIGFDTSALAADQFVLCPVIYDEVTQDEYLLAIVKKVDEFTGRFLTRLVDADRVSFNEIGAHLTNSFLRLLSPQMKDPVFRSENEWRLVSNETWRPGPAENPTRQTCFRLRDGRIVPFKGSDFEHLPVAEIVLGASSPIAPGDQALAVLMEHAFGKPISVRRSTVPLRP